MLLLDSGLPFAADEWNIDSLVQDCSNSSALAMELLQSCTKLSIYGMMNCL